MREHNNYFRLRSYRIDFPKFVGGARDGEYINLDFAMLVDLAIIDMRLRDILLPMALDIEHFSKVRLMNEIEGHGEDGYTIVQDFFDDDGPNDGPGEARERILGEIKRGNTSPYTHGLIESRPNDDWPVWELMEVIPFGRFTHFWMFCAKRFDNRQMRRDFFLLKSVKGLRNGCAHNNCIINDMRAGDGDINVSHELLRELGKIGISKQTRDTKLSNERFVQIASALYLHHKVTSEGVRRSRGESLARLVKRMERNMAYYDHVGPAGSGLAFIANIIRGWYPDCFPVTES
ncbi:MAG: Abi family protein [Coriobacteriales bacterium]|nr:Abi family protein [Coriobacteriales bacterium]